MLDTIVQKELEAALDKDDSLSEIRKNITYANSEQILILLNSIINPDTNWVTPVLPDDEKYAWVNTGLINNNIAWHFFFKKFNNWFWNFTYYFFLKYPPFY